MKLLFTRKFWCLSCSQLKPSKEFGKKKNKCKECVSDYDSVRRYGLDNQQLSDILCRQNNQCAICLKELQERSGYRVDHDHETGVVRGILCNNCNTAIGMLGDNWKNFDRGKEYILSFKTRPFNLEVDILHDNG